MKTNKIRQIIVPPFLGLIIAFILLYLFTQIINNLIHPCDGDEVLDFPYLLVYSLGFFPMLLVSGLFQYLVTLKIWKLYTEKRKFLNLRLWQLTLLSSIIFGITTAYWHWYSFQGIQTLLIYAFSATIITLFYWTANLCTLNYLDKKNGG